MENQEDTVPRFSFFFLRPLPSRTSLLPSHLFPSPPPHFSPSPPSPPSRGGGGCYALDVKVTMRNHARIGSCLTPKKLCGTGPPSIMRMPRSSERGGPTLTLPWGFKHDLDLRGFFCNISTVRALFLLICSELGRISPFPLH